VEQLERAVSLKSEVQSAWRGVAKARAACRSAIGTNYATVIGADSGIGGSDIHGDGPSGSGSHDSRIENRLSAENKLDQLLDNLKAHHEKVLQPTLFSLIINFCAGQMIKITKNTPLLLKMVARPVEVKDDIPSFDQFKSIVRDLKDRFSGNHAQVKECGSGRIVLTRQDGDSLEFMYKQPGKMWVIHNGKWVGDSWTEPGQSIAKSFFEGSKEPYKKIEYSGEMKIPTRLPKPGNQYPTK